MNAQYRLSLSREDLFRVAQNKYGSLDVTHWDSDRFNMVPNKYLPVHRQQILREFRRALPEDVRMTISASSAEATLRVYIGPGRSYLLQVSVDLIPDYSLVAITYTITCEIPGSNAIPFSSEHYIPYAQAHKYGLIQQI